MTGTNDSTSTCTYPPMSEREQPADPADVREREHHRVAVLGGHLEARGPSRTPTRRRSCPCGVRPSDPRWCRTCRRSSATDRPSRRPTRTAPRPAARGPSVDGSPSGSALSQTSTSRPGVSAAIVAGHRLEVEVRATPTGTMSSFAPVWLVMKPHLARRGRSAASGSAPRRAGPAPPTSTIDSSHVGSCHETFVPSPTPELRQPGGGAVARVAVLEERQRAVVLVDRELASGVAAAPLLDEVPQRRPLGDQLGHVGNPPP